MKERPILFSTEMVEAILTGTKTVTRRVVKFGKHVKSHSELRSVHQDGGGNWIFWDTDEPGLAEFTKKAYPGVYGYPCPYGHPGDRLWVKETWQAYNQNGIPYSVLKPSERKDAELYNWAVVDKATSPELKRDIDPWIPSIFMPRWASRITLEITGVRVERVQDITPQDALTEGIDDDFCIITTDPSPENMRDVCEKLAIDRFHTLWDSINAKRGYGWQANPWVWVIEFKQVEPA